MRLLYILESEARQMKKKTKFESYRLLRHEWCQQSEQIVASWNLKSPASFHYYRQDKKIDLQSEKWSNMRGKRFATVSSSKKKKEKENNGLSRMTWFFTDCQSPLAWNVYPSSLLTTSIRLFSLVLLCWFLLHRSLIPSEKNKECWWTY